MQRSLTKKRSCMYGSVASRKSTEESLRAEEYQRSYAGRLSTRSFSRASPAQLFSRGRFFFSYRVSENRITLHRANLGSWFSFTQHHASNLRLFASSFFTPFTSAMRHPASKFQPTNQRYTILSWNRFTGKSLHKARIINRLQRRSPVTDAWNVMQSNN